MVQKWVRPIKNGVNVIICDQELEISESQISDNFPENEISENRENAKNVIFTTVNKTEET